jgi:hypothetical protein
VQPTEEYGSFELRVNPQGCPLPTHRALSVTSLEERPLHWRARTGASTTPTGWKRCYELLDDDERPVAIVSEFLEHLQLRGCSPNTMSAYAYALLHFFRFLIGLGLSWKDFRPPHALVFLKHLRSATARRPTQRLGLAVVPRTGRGVTGLAPESITRVLAAVSSFYEYLILSGQLHERDNPIQVRLDPALARVSERHRPALGAPGTAADLTVAWSSARQSSPHQMPPRVGRKGRIRGGR